MSHLLPAAFALVFSMGCEPQKPTDDCCRLGEAPRSLEALAELDGPRRNGCLAPEVLPEWAALAHIDDLTQLSALIVPFDTGDGRTLKFVLEETGDPWAYFINSAHFGPHWEFTRAIGCDGDTHNERTVGELSYRAADGGGFYFSIDAHPVRDYARVLSAYEVLLSALGVARGELAYRPTDRTQRDLIAAEQTLFDNAPFRVLVQTEDPSPAIDGLNDGVAFGRLRRITPGQIPGPLDIVVLDTLPNDLPLVAGIISATPQTPLAHVNLRAIQDGIPNVYFPPAEIVTRVDPLIGQVVRLEVNGLLTDLRPATPEELMRHFEGRRSTSVRVPRLDLSADRILPLSELGFQDAPGFGAKSANVAELARLELESDVPGGFAVPLSFYVRFMIETGLDEMSQTMMADPRFQTDIAVRETYLNTLREQIRHAEMPADLDASLDAVLAQFPPEVSLRCRSSTNVEDLEDFNGAGLYRSYTHHPDEGRLSKSIKQVYASLWTLRAYEQREFYRIQHQQAAMGVLIHPNYSDERVNGVVITDDVVYRWRDGVYYVNAQVGEDLVTNPEAESLPEELYLIPGRTEMTHFLVRPSNLSPDGGSLLDRDQRSALTLDLQRIHQHFERLYARGSQRFAVDIEFKVDREGSLVIKQVRPWIYGRSEENSCTCR